MSIFCEFLTRLSCRVVTMQRSRYFVDPGLQSYSESAISDIHQRIGGEIHPRRVKRALEELIERGAVRFEGNYRWRRYWAAI